MLDTLHIEQSGVPIYVQIRDQVLGAIGAGVIKPGERMPTMRQVAVALRIDLNTVRHAYDALARTGAVTIHPARGTFVSERQPPGDPSLHAGRLDDLARRTIASARAYGIEPVEVAQRIIAITAAKED
ncbi:MAG TPA: GntR family transcriptional regulator [Acetobacteraceae bacterium]|nr:GntR family transcriptional regulator [Acetobacteraceae bacterium]